MNKSVNGRRQRAAVLAARGPARDNIVHDSLDDFFKVPGGAAIRGHGLDCKARVLFAALEVVAPVSRWGVIPKVCSAGACTVAFRRDERQAPDGQPEHAAESFGRPIGGSKIWPDDARGHNGGCRSMCLEPFAGLDDICSWYHAISDPAF